MKKLFSLSLALTLVIVLAAPAFANGVESLPDPEASPSQAPLATIPPEAPDLPVETEDPQESQLPPQETELPVETESQLPPQETEMPAETDPLGATEVPAETPLPQENGTLEGALESAAPLDTAPDIDVTVPGSGRVIINPYNLPVELSGGISTEQIAAEPLAIVNNSEATVSVQTSAVGWISPLSSAVYTLIPPEKDSLEKEIFLYVEFQNELGAWFGDYVYAANQILISDIASEPQDVLILGPACAGFFQLFGMTSLHPENAWCTDDVISVTITFTFIPLDMPPTEGQISEPEASPMPEASLEPEASPMPEASLEPEASFMPEASLEPEVSPMPEASLEPEASSVPEISLEPEPGAELEGSLLPEDSLGPGLSPAPDKPASGNGARGKSFSIRKWRT